MARRWLVAVVAAVVGAMGADAVAREKFGLPTGPIPPGFVNCKTPDGAFKVKNKPKRNIIFVALAPGTELESFHFMAIRTKKKIQQFVEVGIDSMPFATLNYPVDVDASNVIAFAYERRDPKTGLPTGTWKMDANSAVHVRLKGFNPKKRRLWGEFSAQGLHDTFGGNGPADIANGEFNIKQVLPGQMK